MPKAFMDKDFLLESDFARELYHGRAAACPIIDYHTHLSPREVAEDAGFANLGQAWLGGDHYKWRAMRSNGISEDLVTGSGPGLPGAGASGSRIGHSGGKGSKESFMAWAATMEALPGNPLFHWTHLELRRYFDCDLILNRRNAQAIWDHCNALLARPDFHTGGLMTKMNVEVVCTTDDPLDSLEWHALWHKKQAEGQSSCKTRMFPTFRPDPVVSVDKPEAWRAWVGRLGELTGSAITSLDSLLAALDQRHQYFHDHGCRLSDHGMTGVPGQRDPGSVAETAARRLLEGGRLDAREAEILATRLLAEISAMNRRRGWTMQLHMGPLRSINTRALGEIGVDSGFDALTDQPLGSNLAVLLDCCEQSGGLCRTILYTLNPGSNETIATIMGSFQGGEAGQTIPGKIQFGSAWWFNDHLEGMQRQLKDLAALGALGRFVGMLTDSRSFLSFPRHEYFRRILCNLVGGWVESGQLPPDAAWLGGLVEDISVRNARAYFRFPG